MTQGTLTLAEIEALYHLPFPELLFTAHTVHRERFDPTEIETATLLSIKTGGCPEDCGYCAQSAHYETGVTATRLMDRPSVRAAAATAKARGASRFCLGAAWRNPKARDLEAVCGMIADVKALGLSTCATLGMLTNDQAVALKAAGLDFYNHNVDSGPEFYPQIVSTRTYNDRLDTLAVARTAGLSLCCGGILGMGEGLRDRLEMLRVLSALTPPPESVPINLWSPITGVPVEATAEPPSDIELIRTIAVARVLMPGSRLRLAAGRRSLSEATQALCFFAGINSIFLGERLLTTANVTPLEDESLFARLGLRPDAGIPLGG